MKNILFFGDSNTFGSNPLGGRHPYEKRFTGRIHLALGPEYRVIEEGLGGRTTVFEDEIEQGRCGRDALAMCIATHKPIDLLVIMLGTNDLKARFRPTDWDLARAMEQLLHIIDTYPYAPHFKKPQVLLISPIEIGPRVADCGFGCFTAQAAEQSKRFSRIYAQVAADAGIHFFDAATVARPSAEDQLHMDSENHAKLAAALETKIRDIL